MRIFISAKTSKFRALTISYLKTIVLLDILDPKKKTKQYKGFEFYDLYSILCWKFQNSHNYKSLCFEKSKIFSFEIQEKY